MTTYKDRFKRERAELKDRTQKLASLLDRWEAGQLDFTPDCPFELLKSQLFHMTEYLKILDKRAEIEEVDK